MPTSHAHSCRNQLTHEVPVTASNPPPHRATRRDAWTHRRSLIVFHRQTGGKAVKRGFLYMSSEIDDTAPCPDEIPGLSLGIKYYLDKKSRWLALG